MEVRNLRDFFANREQSMTKTFIVNMCVGLTVFLLVGGIAHVVSAQEDGFTSGNAGAGQATQKQQAGSDQTQEQTQERGAEATQNREQAMLSENSINRVRALAKNISDKSLAGANRLEQIANRFESRILIMQERGIDVNEAQVLVSQAKNHLSNVTYIIGNEVDVLVDEAVYSESPQQNWPAARAKYQEARTELTSAHESLRQALASLKAATNASATTETVTTTTEETI